MDDSQTIIQFTVPAVPIAQPKPAAGIVNGKSVTYEVKQIKNADGSSKPHPIAAFKATVKHAAKLAYDGPPLDCPLFLMATFVFPRPKRLQWKTKPMPRAWHAQKPDCDNLLKGLLDAMSGLVFVDDDQVSSVDVRKVFANGDEQPHVVVVIGSLDEEAEGVDGAVRQKEGA